MLTIHLPDIYEEGAKKGFDDNPYLELINLSNKGPQR